MTRRSFVALAVCTCLFASPSFAWDGDPYLGSVPVVTATGGQYGSRAVSDGAGGAIVVWYDGRVSPSDIYAQRLDATGQALWTANGVAVCTAAGLQSMPVLVSDGAGGAIIAWLDERNDATLGSDVYAQRLNASGTPLWGTNGRAVAAVANDALSLSICTDGAGGAYFAWWDSRANQEIFVQRFNASGTAQFAANGISVSGAGGVKATPVLAPGTAGSAICAWMDARSGDADIYANRVTSTGTLAWGATGTAVSALSGSSQSEPRIVLDGAGGAIIGWLDGRAGAGEVDLYARQFTPAGTSNWGASGLPVCTAVGGVSEVEVASDSAGGAIFVWRDARSTTARIYVRRVTADGGAVWASDGVDVSNGLSAAASPRILGDGAAGAIVAWIDSRNGNSDVFAQRVNALGARLWRSGGESVSLGEDNQLGLSPLVPDDRGGAIAVWDDRHFNDDVFAQRISHGGAIGDPWPRITRVRDVPGDQGGSVVIEWEAASLDVAPTAVANYSIWRRVPSSPTTARPAGAFRVTGPTSALAVFWEYVASVPARARPGYSFVAETTTDSMPGSNPRTSFMVSAEITGSAVYYDSRPDSGYSVDNLAPAPPAALTGEYAAGVTRLHWQRNLEADLAGYRVYRGTTPGFVPGAGNLVAAPSDTGHADAAGAPAYYKVTAVDVHGNESLVASLLPTGTVDVPATPVRAAFFLAAPTPSPLRAGMRASVRLGLAERSHATLELFDALGRRVRTVASGVFEPGEHRVTLDAAGLAPGLYLARLESAGRTARTRLVVLP